MICLSLNNSEMRAGPSQSGDRTWLQTSSSCGGQEPLVVNVELEGAARPRQVWSAKANESEPLMKGRKILQRVSKPELHVGSGRSVGDVLFATGATPGLKAARARIRLSHGTSEPVVSMLRERHKRRPRKAKSTDGGQTSQARHRGGTTRSSDEGPVIGPEWEAWPPARRGRVIQSAGNGSIPIRRERNL